MKRLYRNKSDVMIAGVCSGLAKYFDVDPTAIRLAFVLLLFVGLGGLWIYLVLWIITPLDPGQESHPRHPGQNSFRGSRSAPGPPG